MELECALLEHATVQRGRWRDQRRSSVRSLPIPQTLSLSLSISICDANKRATATATGSCCFVLLFLFLGSCDRDRELNFPLEPGSLRCFCC